MKTNLYKGTAHIHLTVDFYTRAQNSVNANDQLDDEIYHWVQLATGETPVKFDWTWELEMIDG